MSIFSVALYRRERPSPDALASTTSGRCAWFSIAARPSAVSAESPTTRPAASMNVTRAPISESRRWASSWSADGVDGTAPLDQVLQKQKFLRGQGAGRAARLDDMTLGVDRDRSVCHDGSVADRRAIRTPQQRAHARDELVRTERLRQVIVRANFEPHDP